MGWQMFRDLFEGILLVVIETISTVRYAPTREIRGIRNRLFIYTTQFLHHELSYSLFILFIDKIIGYLGIKIFNGKELWVIVKSNNQLASLGTYDLLRITYLALRQVYAVIAAVYRRPSQCALHVLLHATLSVHRS